MVGPGLGPRPHFWFARNSTPKIPLPHVSWRRARALPACRGPSSGLGSEQGRRAGGAVGRSTPSRSDGAGGSARAQSPWPLFGGGGVPGRGQGYQVARCPSLSPALPIYQATAKGAGGVEQKMSQW